MRRLAIAIVLLLALPASSSAQAEINGVAFGATLTLTDSARLPTPITLAWQPGYQVLVPNPAINLPVLPPTPIWIDGFWQGDDPSGATYRVELYDTGGGRAWTVGVEFTTGAGVRQRNFGAWRAIVSRPGAAPVVFRGLSPWNVPNVDITLKP